MGPMDAAVAAVQDAQRKLAQEELLEQIQEKLCSAVQAEWEAGAQWLNEIRAKELRQYAPFLMEAVSEILEMEISE